MTYLSVVIPAYNEASAIRAGKLDRVSVWLAGQTIAAELIVVDDGSQDDTAQLAQPGANKLIRIAHAGKAAALVAGMRQAVGEVILSWPTLAANTRGAVPPRRAEQKTKSPE